MRSFIWRILHKAIPSREALFRKKCSQNPFCPICEDEIETLEHLFLLCPWVLQVWFAGALTLKINPQQVTKVEKWIEDILSLQHTDAEYIGAYVANQLWAIWKARCGWVFEKLEPDPIRVAQIASKNMEDFWSAQLVHDSTTSKEKQKRQSVWQKPPVNSVKINCDGAYCKGNGQAGLGVVCRNDQGLFLLGWAESCYAESAFHAELKALNRAIQLAGTWCGTHVIIEMDCADLFEAVKCKQANKCEWRHQCELADTLQMLEHRSLISFSLIPRKGNCAADCMAAMASREMGPHGLINVSPPLLATIILRDQQMDSAANEQAVLSAERDGIG